MTTLDAILREGLAQETSRISGADSNRAAVISRGRRKKAVRRGIGAAALACMALLGYTGLPDTSLITVNQIAPAGPSFTSDAVGAGIAIDLPEGWRLTDEEEGFLSFSGPGDARVFFVEPRSVRDPAETFGVAEPGPTVLAGWVSSRPEVEPSTTRPSEVGGRSSVVTEGVWRPMEPKELLELRDGTLVAPTEGDAIVIHSLDSEGMLVLGWGGGSSDSVEQLFRRTRFQ